MHYHLPVTSYQLPATRYKLLVTSILDLLSFPLFLALLQSIIMLLSLYISISGQHCQFSWSCLREAPVAHWWSMQNWLSEGKRHVGSLIQTFDEFV